MLPGVERLGAALEEGLAASVPPVEAVEEVGTQWDEISRSMQRCCFGVKTGASSPPS